MKYLIVLLFVLATLGTAACGRAQSAAASKDAAGAGGQNVTVTATDMAFTPNRVEVKAGQPVTLTLKNNGATEHTWTLSLGGQPVTATAQPGQSASTTFTPQTAGTYTIVCTVPGHEQAGMKGTLVAK